VVVVAASGEVAASGSAEVVGSAESSAARFALTRIGLGVLGQVFVRNIGDEPGSVAGSWLCQRPFYYQSPTSSYSLARWLRSA